MTATTELREAAAIIDNAKFSERHHMGIHAPASHAIAAWLIEEADTLDLLKAEPGAALDVARHILKGAA